MTKASGFTIKGRNIMSEISINRFNSKSLRFVVKSAINPFVTNLRINRKIIRAVTLSFGRIMGFL